MEFSNCKRIKDYIRFIFLSKNYNNKFDAFRNFSKEYLNLSKPYFNAENLMDDINNYDKFITGSDQVWNDSITDTDAVYFLDFVKDIAKKIRMLQALDSEKSLKETRRDTIIC